MEQQGSEVHVETDEARGGSTPHVVRWILGISLVLAIIAMSAMWIIPAVFADTHEPTVTDQLAEANEGDDTDSVLLGDADDATTAEEEITGSEQADAPEVTEVEE